MSFGRCSLPISFAILLSGTAHSAETIPQQFRGEWNANLKACGTDLDDSRLMISAHKLSFYESDGFVRPVTVHNPLAITVHSSFSGEGEVWESTDRLVLSRSQENLTINRENTSFTRDRCPLKKR